MDYEYLHDDKHSAFTNGPESEFYPAKVKHSGPGISSFILNLVAIAGYIGGLSLFFVSFYHAGLSSTSDAEEVLSQNSLVAGLFILVASALINVIGIITAIVGLALKNRKKLFAVLGLVFGLVPPLILVILFIIGVMAGGAA